MKLPNSVHEAHPWVMGRIAPDFKLLDVWALPAEGGPEDFDSLLEVMATLDPAQANLASRLLFWFRFRLGGWLGWDRAKNELPIPGRSESTLSDRLPDDLRGSADGLAMGDVMQRAGAGFVPLYRTEDEWAGEISNATVHGVLQLAWVDQGNGRYRGRMGIYVKPRGRLGDGYMMLIAPFRHLIVYPALMRQIARAWDAHRS